MAFTGMSYEAFVADQKRKGINVQGGDGSYNRYTAAQSSGQADAGYTDGGGSALTGGGFQQGVAYESTGQTKGGIPFAGSTKYAQAFSPGAALLRHGLGIGKKTNRDFDGTRDTGGAEAWQKQGGSLAAFTGEIPTENDFTTKGRWLLNKDTYAHDYGRTGLESKYYANFASTLNKFKAAGDMDRFNATLREHGFKAGTAPSAPAPSGGGGSRSPAPSAPPPGVNREVTQKDRDEVTNPAKGLEDTIKSNPSLLRERRRKSYLTAGG